MASPESAGAASGARYRIQPTVKVGIGLIVIYAIVLAVIQQTSGVEYDEFVDSAENAWKAPVLSLGVGAVLLLAFMAWARWDMIWRDPERLPMPRMAWVLLGAFVATMVVRLVGIRYGDIDRELLLAVLCLGVLVGLTEELLFRGFFLRCMRGAGLSEGMAAVWTALAFGLFHLPNVFLGTGVSGLGQVVLAGLSGAALYFFRRAFGLIVVAMVVHGLFDVGTFLEPDYAPDSIGNTAFVLNFIAYVLAAGSFFYLIRNNRNFKVTPAGIVPMPEQQPRAEPSPEQG
ncbi:CPBP family intramembrane glutamic endopeptidase [Kribbella sp. NPDC050281]|uniref:CPBP family intramembrane glutamic endopeptidase n=1 Tax=Kribbella sp. NPDC050281 TaxID=3155515 RepID=UPI0033E79866